MKPVVELPAATAELEQAVAWYEERVPGLGEKLYAAFRDARLAIRNRPKLGAPFEYGTRKRLIPGFPYQVIYTELTDEILIIAVAHESRRPGYWHPRLKE